MFSHSLNRKSPFCRAKFVWGCAVSAFLLLSQQAMAQVDDIPVTVQIKNETNINTKGLEFSPTFYEDGIVFISTNSAGLSKSMDDYLKLPAMSILRSRRGSEGELGAPEPFSKEISSVYHEGPVCFDRTAETIFYSSNSVVGGKEKLDKRGTQRMRLYVSKKNGESWAAPTPLPFNTNQFDDCHPSVSIDGDKLYFASNRPGGFGGMDIYVSYKVGDTWSEPVNLGPVINTKGHDAFPFIHADGTLYYASTGITGGKGGFDLYAAAPDGQEWKTPKNLGDNFNTSGDDLGLIVDLDKINGYFSSNARDGAGGDEIFSFHTENGTLDDILDPSQIRKYDLDILVLDSKSGKPIEGALVSIMNAAAGNPIGRDSAGNLILIQEQNGQEIITAKPNTAQSVEGKTDKAGRYGTNLRMGSYIITGSKQGYKTQQVKVPIKKENAADTILLVPESDYAGKARWNATLFNPVTNAPMAGATVIVIDPTTGKRDTVYADANGTVDHYLDPNKKYKIQIYQGKQFIGEQEVNTQGWTPGQVYNQNYTIAPVIPATAFDLPNIYYNFNDATLRPDARKDLNLVVALLQQHPNITIELASHTDCRGSDAYNQKLSQRRADGATAYLAKKGIERRRLQPMGYGETKPRNQCVDGARCTEKEHARNRRTEIRILTGNNTQSGITHVEGANPEPQKAGIPSVTPLPMNSKSNGGRFYVIAGSFLSEENARNRQNTLKENGYVDAEIVRFPKSNLYSVCAGKFSQRTDAMAMEKALESTGVDAFVRDVK